MRRQSWYMTKGRCGHRQVSRGYFSDTWVAGQYYGHVIVTSHRSVLDFEFDTPGGERIQNGRRVRSLAPSLLSLSPLVYLSPSLRHAPSLPLSMDPHLSSSTRDHKHGVLSCWGTRYIVLCVSPGCPAHVFHQGTATDSSHAQLCAKLLAGAGRDHATRLGHSGAQSQVHRRVCANVQQGKQHWRHYRWRCQCQRRESRSCCRYPHTTRACTQPSVQ